MSKKAREKPAEAGSASMSPYGSVLGYELVTSQPNRFINLIWPECRTWFIGPCIHLLRSGPGSGASRGPTPPSPSPPPPPLKCDRRCSTYRSVRSLLTRQTGASADHSGAVSVACVSAALRCPCERTRHVTSGVSVASELMGKPGT